MLSHDDEIYQRGLIITDNKTKTPILDFGYYNDAIVKIIKNSYPNFTIGIYGEWGTGKTTLMDSIKHLKRIKEISKQFGLMHGNMKMKKNLL